MVLISLVCPFFLFISFLSFPFPFPFPHISLFLFLLYPAGFFFPFTDKNKSGFCCILTLFFTFIYLLFSSFSLFPEKGIRHQKEREKRKGEKKNKFLFLCRNKGTNTYPTLNNNPQKQSKNNKKIKNKVQISFFAPFFFECREGTC